MNEPIYNEYSKKDIIPILQTALEDGIISADSVLDTIMATKRQQVRNMHPYVLIVKFSACKIAFFHQIKRRYGIN